MDCLFCDIIAGKKESKKIYEDELVIAIMDAFPTVDGHVLIIPKKHFTTFKDIDEKTLIHMHTVAKNLTDKLMDKLNAEALTLTVNYGTSQAIKHLHLHLMPNYTGKKTAKENVDEIYEKIK